MYEFGTSKAAAWDCPVTVVSNFPVFRRNPRTDDILEVMRRWEDFRACGCVTEEVKKLLRNADEEHTLLINESGEYELVKYTQVEVTDGVSGVRAFVFERNGVSCAVIWDDLGSSRLTLPLEIRSYTREIDTLPIEYAVSEGNTVLPVSCKGYIKADVEMSELVMALKNATVIR